MSLQHQLDEMSIASLPRIKKLIDESKKFEANQMYQYARHKMMNAWKPVIYMSIDELDEFQDDLIKIFEHHNWI